MGASEDVTGGKADGVGDVVLPLLPFSLDPQPPIRFAIPAVFAVDLHWYDKVAIDLNQLPTADLILEVFDRSPTSGERPLQASSGATHASAIQWVGTAPDKQRYYISIRDIQGRKLAPRDAVLTVTCLEGPCASGVPEEELTDPFETNPIDHPAVLPIKDEGKSITLEHLNIASATDEDWFTFKDYDKLDFGNPAIVATVRGTAAPDLEVTVFWECSSPTHTAATCTRGQSDVTMENTDHPLAQGCRAMGNARILTNCSGTTTDNGQAFVRVRAAQFGHPIEYRLDIGIE
jgi:hypothetical protein